MGFIKGGSLVIISVFLFIILFLGNVFFVLSLSLDYENVQEELSPILQNLTENKLNITMGDFNLTEEMEEAREFMMEHCQNETSYVFARGGYTFVLPCDLLEEIDEDPQSLIDQGMENIVEQIYYDDYDCKFWNCFQETGLPLFLISEKAKNYWQDKFYFTLIAFAVMAVLIFFLVEHKQNILIIVGSILALSSLPLLGLEKVIGSIIGNSYFAFVGVFFNKIDTVFWIVFFSGLIIVGAGIALKFLRRDSIKKKFSKKDVQKLIKKSDEKKNTEVKSIKKKK
jgi:ABC-type multidrug transport system fused ATPase/permease subunit